MFRIQLTAKAKKELRSLSKSDKLSLGEIIEELKENPFIGKPLSRELIKKFSYKVGVYRVIYKINQLDKIITVISAGQRSTIVSVLDRCRSDTENRARSSPVEVKM